MLQFGTMTCNTGPGGLALFDHVLRHGEAARVLRIIFPDVRSSLSTDFFPSVRQDKKLKVALADMVCRT
jgi:hypothetical protein